MVAAQGDRYILRQPSPSQTLGGGAVVDAHPRRRWRRFSERVVERLELLSAGAPEDILLDTLGGRAFQDADEVVANSGLDVDAAQAALDELTRSQAIVALPISPKPALLTAFQRDEALRLLNEIVSAYHAEYPLRGGMPKGELRTRLSAAFGSSMDAKAFNALVDHAQALDRITAVRESVKLPDFEIALSTEQRERVERVLRTLAAAGVSAPSQSDLLAQLGGDERLQSMLLEQGRVIRIGDGIVYRREDFDEMTDRVRAHILEHESITLAETRDLFGTSRRYAQAILEELDARGLTRRVGINVCCGRAAAHRKSKGWYTRAGIHRERGGRSRPSLCDERRKKR